MSFTTLVTNFESIKAEGLDPKNNEISVAISNEDLFTGKENLVAYRWSMAYSPKNDFKPEKGNTLPSALQYEFFKMIPEAQEKLKEIQAKIGNTKNTSSSENGSEFKEVVNKLKNENSEFKNTLKSQINIIEEQKKLIEDLRKNQPAKKVVHKAFYDLVKLMKNNFSLYLYGPAGTGKSKLAEDIAEEMELDFYPASTVTQEFKLTGYEDGNGRYHETNFYKAITKGGIFFLDEMDSCSSDVLVGINGALANGYFDFPNETVRAHKNFKVIAAGNTIGRGGNEMYTGRYALDMSTLDRFISYEINYDKNIDLAVAENDKDLVEFAWAVRTACDTSGINLLVSYRAIGNIIKLKKLDFDLSAIMKMALIKGVAIDDINMIIRNMTIEASNKYYKALKAVS